MLFYYYSPAIQENLSSIDWDNPQQALLSLASIVENNMGGSSGAVNTLILKIFVVTLFFFFLPCRSTTCF